MAATTAIDWTDATPNPLTRRCTKVAPECLNCDTETLTSRREGRGAFISGPPRVKPGELLEPWNDKRMREAYRKFRASMSGPFHGKISLEDQAPLFAMMAADRFIAGGESGGHHRPLDLDDARALRDQCLANDVPFWFKLLCTKPFPARVLSAVVCNHQVRRDL